MKCMCSKEKRRVLATFSCAILKRKGVGTLEGWVRARQEQGHTITIPATAETINSINNVKRYTARVSYKKAKKVEGGSKRGSNKKTRRGRRQA